MPDFSRSSWRLKVARAEDHLREFEVALGAYAESRPYSAERRLKRKNNRDVWDFFLRADEHPDPKLAMILGDCIHNLRAALDHLACACVVDKKKRKSAGFPIETRNLWVKIGRRFALREKHHAKDRASFARRIKHLPKAARTIIHLLQPHRGDVPERNILALISRLDNTDKHREIILSNVALHQIRATLNIMVSPTMTWWMHLPDIPNHCDNNTQLYSIEPPGDHPADAEVHMQLVGTPCVTIDVRGRRQRTDVARVMRYAIEYFPKVIFPALEPFVRT